MARSSTILSRASRNRRVRRIERTSPCFSKTIEISGLNLLYREAGDPSRPKLLLLHGFPASSHQYRNLIPALARDLARASAKQVQLDLFYDYRTNVALYPHWQAFLKERQPKTIIFWGQNDIFFTPQAGEAYLQALPNAEMHRLDSGHFAVEDSLSTIAANMIAFHNKYVAG